MHVCTRRGQPSPHLLPWISDLIHPSCTIPCRFIVQQVQICRDFFFLSKVKPLLNKAQALCSQSEIIPSIRFTCSQQTNVEKSLLCACLQDAERALPACVAVVTHAAAPSWLHFYLCCDLLFVCNSVVCKHSAALLKSSCSNPPWAAGCVTSKAATCLLSKGTDPVSWQFSWFPGFCMDEYRKGAKYRPWFYLVELGCQQVESFSTTNKLNTAVK